jgi:F420-dependent oxidoreductase-like protein
MKLGIALGYSPAGVSIPMEDILEAEQLGFESVWTAEAYGSDAVTPAAWILAQTSRIKVGTAIMQMPARTPTMTAMTAMTLDQLSGGRFVIGLGPSGPQVVEGWYGVPYGRPLTRTREYIDIIRQVLAREAPLVHQGFHYQIPFDGEGASGLGKPLKSILHGDPEMKIYTAAITPAGLRCAGEVADGVFPIWANPERSDTYMHPLREGMAKRDSAPEQFDVAPFVMVAMGDDLDACRLPIKYYLSLYVGGMGAKSKNFYKDYTARLGYEEAAERIQALFLEGKKDEAAAAVPDALIDDCALVGPAGRIRERLAAWRAAGDRGDVGTMLLSGASRDAMKLLAEELL